MNAQQIAKDLVVSVSNVVISFFNFMEMLAIVLVLIISIYLFFGALAVLFGVFSHGGCALAPVRAEALFPFFRLGCWLGGPL